MASDAPNRNVERWLTAKIESVGRIGAFCRDCGVPVLGSLCISFDTVERQSVLRIGIMQENDSGPHIIATIPTANIPMRRS